MPKINMGVVINVMLSGSQAPNGSWNITDTYSQGMTTPTSNNVVDTSGNITLTNLNYDNNNYKNDTDLSFVITSNSVTDMNGNPATVYFWSPRSDAISISPTPGNNEFGAPGDDGSGLVLTITDRDDDSGNYQYTLYISCNGTKVGLEPGIVNRGTN